MTPARLLVLAALVACGTPAPASSGFGGAKPRGFGEAYEKGPSELEGGFAHDPIAGTPVDPSKRPRSHGDCSLAFAFSGGGTVAASFAFGVVERMEQQRRVVREVDYLSTASGGGLTAALLIDMLRESPVRGDGGPEGFDTYFASGRFRSALDEDLLGEGGFLFGALQGSGSLRLLDNLDRKSPGGMRFTLSTGAVFQATTSLAAPVMGMPKVPECTRAPIAFTDGTDPTGCQVPGVGELTFGEVWNAGNPLPVWLPGVTIFDTGTNVPFVPRFIDALGIEAVRFSTDGAWVPRDQLTYRHALVLSMAFPGIGPLLGRTHGTPPRYLDLADGGQSDNLGVLHATAAVASDLRGKRAARGLVVVVDSAVTMSSPFHGEPWLDAKRFRETLFNAEPALNGFRQVAPMLAEGIAREAGVSDRTRVVFVRLSDLLESREPLQFPELLVPDCVDNGRPLDRAHCLDPKHAVTEHPWERLRSVSTSLALTRRQVEDLVLAGNATVDRNTALGPALDWCLAD